MTNIRCSNDREEYTIDIDGHAGYNPGNDIVCAGVSILGFTLLNAIENQITDVCEITMIDGDIHIRVKGTVNSQQDIRTIVETIMFGYELLEDQYPANISVEW